MKTKTFFFHYNKPASQKSGSPKMTIHFAGVCHLVDYIICHAMCYTHHSKRQPHCVMKGKCTEVVMRNDPENKLTGIIQR